MKKVILAFMLIALSEIATAQFYKDYSWDDADSLTAVPEDQKEQSLVTLLKRSIYEYDYVGPERDFSLFFTFHEIKQVNNDEAVELSNRIYIPLAGSIEIIEIKARTILPNGEVIVLDESNIKEIEDEDGGEGFKIFALEGVQVGSKVEVLYTKKMQPQYFGREYLQSKYPVKNGEFMLISPWNLEFDFRAYNSNVEVIKLDDNSEKNTYQVKYSNIPGLTQEAFSFYNSYRARIDYKLAYNAASGKTRLFTWSNAADRIYFVLSDIDKQEEKDIAKLSKEIGIKSNWTNERKIRHIENYVKSNYYYDEYQNAENLSFIRTNKIVNDRGAVKLYIHLLNQLNINHEIVMTSDRTKTKFDPEFDNWNFLESYLLYFPELDKYLDPTNYGFRMGIIPPIYNDNYGLFIRGRLINDEKIGVGEVKQIKARSYKENFDNLDIQVSFNEDFTETNIKATRNFQGVTSTFYKAAYPQLDSEKQQLLLKDLIKFLALDAEISDVQLTNTSFDYMDWDKPFEVQANFSTNTYTDLAGSIILFKVGQLIGPQSELYQENERLTGVENDFNRGYLRKLSVNIPEGYFIENPEDINMDFVVKNGDKEIFLFKSSYELKDGKLDIQIDEFYDQISYSKKDFEDFRKVINAAADWNKIVLVMKKSNQ